LAERELKAVASLVARSTATGSAGVDYKAASGDLAGRVSQAFGLPHDYFPEYREDFALATVRRDDRLRDSLYDRLSTSERSKGRGRAS